MPPKALSGTPLWEKIAGLIGFILIVLMLGYLGWSALADGDSPPQIEFEIIDIHSAPGNHLVRVLVRNSGEQVAMNLNVEVSLHLADNDVEQSVTEVDYLPVESDQELGFYFQNNPAAGELIFRALNYQVP